MGKSKTDQPGLAASARKIWLAGLGALAEAEQRGDKFFKSLGKKGRAIEPTFHEPVESAGEAIKESMAAAKDTASRGFNELEAAIDRGVASAMKRAGLASSKEVDALRKEIAKLKRETRKTAGSANKRAKKKVSTKKKKKPARTT
jgi:poly(hydroxyalkanoate) granule-associated protein